LTSYANKKAGNVLFYATTKLQTRTKFSTQG